MMNCMAVGVGGGGGGGCNLLNGGRGTRQQVTPHLSGGWAAMAVGRLGLPLTQKNKQTCVCVCGGGGWGVPVGCLPRYCTVPAAMLFSIQGEGACYTAVQATIQCRSRDLNPACSTRWSTWVPGPKARQFTIIGLGTSCTLPTRPCNGMMAQPRAMGSMAGMKQTPGATRANAWLLLSVAGQAVAIAVVARIRGTAPRIPASASGGRCQLEGRPHQCPRARIKKKPNVGTAVPLWLSWLQKRLSAKPGKKPKSCRRCKVPGCAGRGTAFPLLSSFRLCCVTVTSSLIR